MEFINLKNQMIKNINIDEKTMHIKSMGDYVKRITVK